MREDLSECLCVLAAHLKEKHGLPLKPHWCPDCDFKTDKKSRLLSHRIGAHATSKKTLGSTDRWARFE